MAKLTGVSINLRRWTNSKDKVFETLILKCLPEHYGWEAAQKAYYYTQRILKKRWPEGEKVILDNNQKFAYLYAKNIIKGRWKEAESFIATDEYSSYFYAKYVLKGRFAEFEDNLFNHKEKIKGYIDYEKLVNYARFFLKNRLPRSYERKLCERGYEATNYAIHVLKKRWKAAEKSIVKYTNRKIIDLYIRSLKSVKDRREFRTLLLAESMAKDSWGHCAAQEWIKENEKSQNPVTF